MRLMSFFRTPSSAAPGALAALAIGLAAASFGATAHAEDKPDGKKIFEEQKCTKCHKPGSKRDLAGVGKRRKPDEIKAILRHEKLLDGKKHKKKFEGSDAELEALVKWVSSLK